MWDSFFLRIWDHNFLVLLLFVWNCFLFIYWLLCIFLVNILLILGLLFRQYLIYLFFVILCSSSFWGLFHCFAGATVNLLEILIWDLWLYLCLFAHLDLILLPFLFEYFCVCPDRNRLFFFFFWCLDWLRLLGLLLLFVLLTFCFLSCVCFSFFLLICNNSHFFYGNLF